MKVSTKKLMEKRPAFTSILKKLPSLFESPQKREFKRLKEFINGYA
ncbi:MAG: hypothetical protein JWN76_3114 [Chitinophagaceae bacterium]|nr:hypothetical protein [Chitinophagaceae bacterium]